MSYIYHLSHSNLCLYSSPPLSIQVKYLRVWSVIKYHLPGNSFPRPRCCYCKELSFYYERVRKSLDGLKQETMTSHFQRTTALLCSGNTWGQGWRVVRVQAQDQLGPCTTPHWRGQQWRWRETRYGVKVKPTGFLDHLTQNNQSSSHSALSISSSVLFAYISLSKALKSLFFFFFFFASVKGGGDYLVNSGFPM